MPVDPRPTVVSCQRFEFTNAYATVGMADNSGKPELRKVKLQLEYDTRIKVRPAMTGWYLFVVFSVLCESRLLTCT